MPEYSLNFAGLEEYLPLFFHGLGVTALLAAIATTGGVILGILGAVIRNGSRTPLYWIWTAYVETIRNTPFIIQLFFIFFGLPQLGFRFSAESASAAALILNLGAYATEIIRAGIAVTPRGQWEAARVLGLSRFQTFTRVVLPPAIRRVYPSLVSQCVLVRLGSAVVSQISCEDLTFAASYAQSVSFLSFECYLLATALYLGLAFVMRQLMLAAGRLVFRGGF